MERTVYQEYTFSGTHTEVGRQHGETLRQPLRQHLDVIYALAGRQPGFSRERALETAMSLEPYIGRFAPGFVDELRGLAEGAGISYREAVLLQARQEVVNLDRLGGGRLECTSFMAGPSVTANGHTYAGQNADLTGDFGRFTYLLTFAVTGKPKIKMITPAGQISYLGMNDRGMSANCNFLVCEGWKRGFPRYLISRLLLEQPDLQTARQLMLRLERASSRNILLCQDGGQAVDFENTAAEIAAIEAGGGYFVHSNHFLSPRMQRYERSNPYELLNSRTRLARLSQLMEANRGRIDSALLQSFLRDHENGVHSICMHPDPPENHANTFASMIFDLTDRTMDVARNNPCQNEYVHYTF